MDVLAKILTNLSWSNNSSTQVEQDSVLVVAERMYETSVWRAKDHPTMQNTRTPGTESCQSSMFFDHQMQDCSD